MQSKALTWVWGKGGPGRVGTLGGEYTRKTTSKASESEASEPEASESEAP